MKRIGIVAGGPQALLADLSKYQNQIDYWIGCDRGALYLIEQNIAIDLAIGDFDSVNQVELDQIKALASRFSLHPIEKDMSDLELAVAESIEIGIEELFLFGVSGGRKDHELASIFLLEGLADKNIKASIIDRQNSISIYNPGKYAIQAENNYPIISFLALSERVTGLTLNDFYYPLEETAINRCDSLTLSNHLIEQTGHFSFESGILIVIKSSEQI